jgi:hypothetical protein
VTATRPTVERDGRISPRVAAWVAWSAWALLAGLTILVQTPTTEGFSFSWVPAALGLGSFMTVGAVVVSRQPHNRIGWLCCAAGLLGGLAAFSFEYAGYALGPHGGSLPGGLAMAWLNGWVGTFWAGLVLLFLPVSHRPAAVAALAAGRLGVLGLSDGAVRPAGRDAGSVGGIRPAQPAGDR